MVMHPDKCSKANEAFGKILPAAQYLKAEGIIIQKSIFIQKKEELKSFKRMSQN